MAKIQLPQSSEDVKKVMKDYILKKKFSFSDTTIEYMAEDFYLYFSGKEWAGVRYWPSVAMRWVLNNVTKFGTLPMVHRQEETGPTLKDKILKEQQDNAL